MEDLLLELVTDSYVLPIQNAQMEYELACAGLVESVTNALEVYECAYMLNQYESVQEASGDSSEANKKNKEANDKFFDKIIGFVKKMLGKLKHAATVIVDKVKKFATTIKNIVHGAGQVMTGRKPVAFKNGFKVNLVKGLSRVDEFSSGYMKLSRYVEDFFNDFLDAYKDENKFKEFSKNREKDIRNLSAIDINNQINMFINLDVPLEGSAQNWVLKAFEFKQVEEKWIPSVNECMSMANDCIDASKRDTLGLAKNLTYHGVSKFENLQNTLIRAKNDFENYDTTKASVLSKLINVTANYSSVGVGIISTAINFYISKFSILTNYLVSTKYLTLK